MTAGHQPAVTIDPEGLPALPCSLPAFFRLLANDRRRAAIRVLAAVEPDRSLTTNDLVYAMTARLEDTSMDALPAEAVQSTRVTLLQNHLDQLLAHGILEEHGQFYRPGPTARPFARWLDAITTACDRGGSE